MTTLTITRGSWAYRLLMGALMVATIAVVVWLPHHYTPYRVFQFSEVLVFAIAILGLNLLTGYSGQISLGHSFFFAIGAYTTAILLSRYGLPFAVPILVAFVVSFAVGFAVGVPALRLTGVYLALVTVALAVVTPPVIKRFGSVTGGSQGITIEQPVAPAWTGLADDQWLYYICLVVAAIAFLTGRNLVRGRVGRALTGIRDNELAARTMGVNAAATKTLAFAYSAGFAGVAGALYTLVIGFAAPDSFSIILAINLLVGAVVGGVATIAGAVIGALFIVFVPVLASDVNAAAGGLIFGLAVIAIMLAVPGGVLGVLHRVRKRVLTIAEPAAPTATPESAGPVTTADRTGVTGTDTGSSLGGGGSAGDSAPDSDQAPAPDRHP